MDIDNIKKRYEALGRPCCLPGERGWTDRIETFDMFMKNGAIVVESLKKLDPDDREFCKSIAPAHWELLHEVFG